MGLWMLVGGSGSHDLGDRLAAAAVGGGEEALVFVGAPTGEGEPPALIGQDLVTQVAHVVPSVGNGGGDEVATDLGALSVAHLDFVGAGGGVHGRMWFDV